MKIKTIVESLRMIVTKLGGTVEPNESVKSLVSEIADTFEPGGGGGGSDLPAVTSADNNKVLTVVNGNWDKAEPARELPNVTSTDNGKVMTVVGGIWGKADLPSDVAIFNMYDYTTLEDPDTTQYVVYATFEEISAAYNAGKICVARHSGIGYGFTDYLINGYTGRISDNQWALFVTMHVWDPDVSGEVTKQVSFYAELPDHPYPSTNGTYIPD